MTAINVERLRELAEKAFPEGQSGDWYVVRQPWLPANAEPYIVAGSPDPHAGLYVCDFVETFTAGTDGDWTEDEWSSRNWSIAEFVEAADPTTIIALCDRVKILEARLSDFMGGDPKLQVGVGGNPNYVDAFLDDVRSLLSGSKG